VADERSDVDMTERREPPAEPGSHPPIASATELAPPQKAWGAYVDHATRCDTCRSLDAGRCETAETLHRAYQAAGSEAYRQLHDGTPGR
jgi:hypothetical protein